MIECSTRRGDDDGARRKRQKIGIVVNRKAFANSPSYRILLFLSLSLFLFADSPVATEVRDASYYTLALDSSLVSVKDN